VNPLFQQWLEQHFPQRAGRIMARIRDMRGGNDYDAVFGQRMTGQGVWAQLLKQRFDKACARLGLNRERVDLDLSKFTPPALSGQASLF
jgi:DNA repair photolyase